MLEYLRAHAMPRVANCEHHVIAGPGLWDAPGEVGIERGMTGLDRERAAFGHSVPCVDRKVEDRVVDLAGIGQGPARVWRASQRDGHLLAERSPQQLNCARDAIIEIQ